VLEHTPVGNPKTYAIVDTQRGLHEESQKRTVEYQSRDLGVVAREVTPNGSPSIKSMHL
jgi:hypothetical protein